MNKFNILFLTLAICAGLSPRFAYGEEEANPQLEEKVQAVKSLLTVSTLREAAGKNTSEAVKAFFNTRAELRWKRLAKEFSEEQLNDFFYGAVVLDGKNNNDTALYNPFWDTILLLSFDRKEEIPKVDRFALVSGCKFRGEPYAENPSDLEGTVPKANPFAVDLWSVTARTKKHYETVYVPQAEAELTKFQPTDNVDMEKIQIRSAVRLKLLLKFLQNKTMQREARRISNYLTAGNEKKLFSYFKDGGAKFIPNFAKLRPEVRQHFVPYCYFPGKEATLFVFFNSAMPRVIVTVTYPRKGISRILEWYDLMASEELMAVWNKSKEDK